MPLKNNIFKASLILGLILTQSLFSQVGIGAFGAYKYPGLQSSKQYNIHFSSGFGYGFYVKHDFIKFENSMTYLRYLGKITNHNANLPGGLSGRGKSSYKFSNLSFDMIYEFFAKNKNKYYTGFSVNLLQTLSEGKFRATYAGSTLYPSIFLGWERNLVEGFDIFSELQLDYGKTDADAGPEEIPITGVSILIGITMYISE